MEMDFQKYSVMRDTKLSKRFLLAVILTSDYLKPGIRFGLMSRLIVTCWCVHKSLLLSYWSSFCNICVLAYLSICFLSIHCLLQPTFVWFAFCSTKKCARSVVSYEMCTLFCRYDSCLDDFRFIGATWNHCLHKNFSAMQLPLVPREFFFTTPAVGFIFLTHNLVSHVCHCVPTRCGIPVRPISDTCCWRWQGK